MISLITTEVMLLTMGYLWCVALSRRLGTTKTCLDYLISYTCISMVGYTDYVVYPVVQFIHKVHQLLFSEDLGKNINSSSCIHFHMASHNFSAFVE